MSSSKHPRSQIPNPKRGPNLLTIPLELRLHIYHSVLLSHPIHHAHLAPLLSPNLSGLNSEDFHTTMIRSINSSSSLPSRGIMITDPITPSSNSSKPGEPNIFTTLPRSHYSPSQKHHQHQRIQGKIPTALLTSCRQIYNETAPLPWTTNTFSFTNCFPSGLYAAKSFTGRLSGWQRDLIRQVEIEVLGSDLLDTHAPTKGGDASHGENDGGGPGEWRDLCHLWAGVQSLKLAVKGALSSSPAPRTPTPTTSANHNQSSSVLDPSSPWLSRDLRSLSSLRYLQLGIEDEDVSSDVKRAFCAELEGVLNGEGRASEFTVVFTESVRVVPKDKDSEGAFVYYGGEPGGERA